jgi:hypothetical protein
MAARSPAPVAHDDRVLPITKAVSVAIIPFLVAAFVVLYLWPQESGRLFAWPIMPPLTAMLLASVYLGGAYFFLRAASAHRWHTVKAGFPPVATFATLLGVATVLHWDRFTHSHVAFWLWAGLYFTTPFLITAVWIANRRQEGPAALDDVVVSEGAARAIGSIGILAGLMSLFLFVFPERAIALWPWMLTPLTARVMGGIFALGIAAVGAFADHRWSAMRIMVQVEVVMLVLILVGAARAVGDVDASNALTWFFAVGFAGLLVASLALYVRMEQRGRRASEGSI